MTAMRDSECHWHGSCHTPGDTQSSHMASLYNLSTQLKRKYHVTEEMAEAQRGKVMCLKLYNGLAEKIGFNCSSLCWFYVYACVHTCMFMPVHACACVNMHALHMYVSVCAAGLTSEGHVEVRG